jgi:prevent-host-death family protein
MSEVEESVRTVREHFAEVIDRSRDHPTVITRNSRPVAAVVSIELLRRYEELEDQEALRIIKERMSDRTPGISLGEVLAETMARP